MKFNIFGFRMKYILLQKLLQYIKIKMGPNCIVLKVWICTNTHFEWHQLSAIKNIAVLYLFRTIMQYNERRQLVHFYVIMSLWFTQMSRFMKDLDQISPKSSGKTVKKRSLMCEKTNVGMYFHFCLLTSKIRF